MFCKKKFFFPILFLLSLHHIHAQVIWDKTYTWSYADDVEQLIETTDSAYFVMGNYHYMKLSSDGDTLFNSPPSNMYTYYYNACAALPDGGVVLGGVANQLAFITILDRKGNVERTKIFSDFQNYAVNNLVVVEDQIYAGVTNFLSEKAIKAIWKLDMDLDSSWTSSQSGIVSRMFFHPSDQLVALFADGNIIRLDPSSGKTMSQKKTFKGNVNHYTSSPTVFVEQNGAYHFLLNPNNLVKISAQDDSTSSYEFPGNSRAFRGFVAQSNGYAFLSKDYAQWYFDWTDLNFNNLGSVQFNVTYPKSTACLIQDKKGDFIFGGSAQVGTLVPLVLKYSIPGIVTSLSEEKAAIKPKQVAKVYTLMGQEIAPNQVANGFYIYRYDDGSSQKVLRTE